MLSEREVPLLMQRKPVATLNEYTGKPVMKSALRAYESAAAAAHEIPPGGGTKAARCAAYSARQFPICHSFYKDAGKNKPETTSLPLYCMPPAIIQAKTRATAI